MPFPVTPSPYRFLVTPAARPPTHPSEGTIPTSNPLRPLSGAFVPPSRFSEKTITSSPRPRFNIPPRFKDIDSPDRLQRSQYAQTPSQRPSTWREDIIDDGEDETTGVEARSVIDDADALSCVSDVEEEQAEWVYEEEDQTIGSGGDNRNQDTILKDPNAEETGQRKRRRISIAAHPSPNGNEGTFGDMEQDADHHFENLLKGFEDPLLIIGSPVSDITNPESLNNLKFVLPPATPTSRFLPRPSGRQSYSESAAPLPMFNIPPRFKLPEEPTPSQTAEGQLPDIFSPHRRGRKYVPGGLAGDVAGWLLDMGNASSDTAGRKTIERYTIAECKAGQGAGLTFVIGKKLGYRNIGQDCQEEVRLLLIGNGDGKRDIRPGRAIAVRGKGWELEVQGTRWRVCLRWEIVS